MRPLQFEKFQISRAVKLLNCSGFHRVTHFFYDFINMQCKLEINDNNDDDDDDDDDNVKEEEKIEDDESIIN